MQCSKCAKDVPTGKFCLNCGASLLPTGPSRSNVDIDIAWIAEILSPLGYTIELGKPTKEGEKPTTLLATHAANANLYVDLRASVRFLLITSSWRIKPPGVFDKSEFFRALNHLNADTIAVQCSCDEKDPSGLNIQVGFFLPETISPGDIAAFVEQADRLMSRAIHSDRFKPYAQ